MTHQLSIPPDALARQEMLARVLIDADRQSDTGQVLKNQDPSSRAVDDSTADRLKNDEQTS